jgi:hypothetical protein
MRTFWLVALLALVHALVVGRVAAQGVAQSEIVVPTFGVFSVGTTISVPDRGYTSLGGAHHASDVRNEFGPVFGRGFSSRRVASDAGVRVWIHDFEEMEQALARSRVGESSRPVGGFAGRVYDYTTTRPVSKESTGSAGERVLANKAKAAADDAAFKTSHAADMLKRGQDAEQRGKLNVAALYYKSVMSLGATPSAPAAKQRLASIESKLVKR